jgi:predicted XRE-type DNA-binding protein
MGRLPGVYKTVPPARAGKPDEAVHLRVRREMMVQIKKVIKSKGWTQAQAGQRCGLHGPRISDLVQMRVKRFSLDKLVNIATALGRRVRIELYSPLTGNPIKTKGIAYESVWDGLADAPEEAANLRARAQLMREIESIVKGNGWDLAHAAKLSRVERPRMNDLLLGRASLFTLEALVKIAKALRRRVRMKLRKA